MCDFSDFLITPLGGNHCRSKTLKDATRILCCIDGIGFVVFAGLLYWDNNPPEYVVWASSFTQPYHCHTRRHIKATLHANNPFLKHNFFELSMLEL